VDLRWLYGGGEIQVQGLNLHVAPLEEMVWAKLYVLNRERCDWPDVLNMLYFCCGEIDWRHLLNRLGPDAPLLAGVLSVLSWLAPDRMKLLPSWLLEKLRLHGPPPAIPQEELQWRATLLNPRDWFVWPLEKRLKAS
jgi:hypothetical protein